MSFNRKDDLRVTDIYENAIELHFINVVDDLRKEWVFLKGQETLEKRNKRLLCELECLYTAISQK
jgi:hypothetical protein